MSEKENNPSINEGRVERILSEYLVPDQKFRDEKIENMIVFLGLHEPHQKKKQAKFKKRTQIIQS